MSITQKQIAEELNVSIALVSRVLSGRSDEIGIAPATRDRVLEVAEELGYVPSAAALTLKGKATNTIGIAVLDFTDPFFGRLIQQIQILAHQHNYSLILTGFLNRIPDRQDLNALHKHAIDGLLILGSETHAPWLKDFKKLPIVRIGHADPKEKSVRVTVDESLAARQIIHHLARRQRKQIACLTGNLFVHIDRSHALQQEAAAQGLPLTPIAVDLSDRAASGYAAAKKALETIPSVDAMVCACDTTAIGALNFLHEAGIRVPDQIAVTGFDGTAAAKHFIPAISTLEQPTTAIAERAFFALHNKLAPQEIFLPGTFIVRASA